MFMTGTHAHLAYPSTTHTTTELRPHYNWHPLSDPGQQPAHPVLIKYLRFSNQHWIEMSDQPSSMMMMWMPQRHPLTPASIQPRQLFYETLSRLPVNSTIEAGGLRS